MCHGLVDSIQVGNDGADFLFGKDSGNAFIFLRAERGKGGFVERNLEDVAVEKEDCTERLVLGGFGGFSFNDKMCDELVDFADGHLAGVDGDLTAVKAGVVIADVFANPVQVGLFGTGRILFQTKLVAVEVEEFF